MPVKPQPTLLDVARRAGVSPATVSRVLNNNTAVNEQTRVRVLETVSELGYRQRGGRSTAKGPVTVGLVITDILNPFFPEMVRGVEDEGLSDGTALLLCNTSEDAQRERQALTMLIERRVNGVIIAASRLPSTELVAFRERHAIPMVVLNRRIEHPEIPCIVVDFEKTARRVAEHLLALNHTRIAYLAGPEASDPSRARRHGIEAALAAAGLRLRPAWCPPSFPSVEGGFQAMSMLLALPPGDRPTAVIVFNDVMALGALHAVRTCGMHVPDDVSVVGCDGIAMAAHSNPPLTTIDQPKYRMGRIAMQMLRQMMQGVAPAGGGYTLLESPLVVRESTAPLPTLHPSERFGVL